MTITRLASLASLASLLPLLACADRDPTVDQGQQALWGGDNDNTGYPAVCALRVTPPPTDADPAPEPFFCTGTLVGEAILLTSASCVWDVEANAPLAASAIEVHFGPSFAAGEAIAVVDVEVYRQYGSAAGTQHELALVQLAGGPTVAPATPYEVNAEPVPDDLATVTLVGFGASMPEQEPLGQRTKLVGLEVRGVTERTIVVGEDGATSCDGDGGGPVFAELGGDEVLVAITERHAGCSATADRIRLDPYARDFIHAFVDREEGACASDGTCETSGCRTPDPDCDDSGCAWDGDAGDVDCVADCPTRDLDCPLGVYVGDVCALDGDCENAGRCVAADDDASFEYCTQPCGGDEACPTERGMSCVEGECRHGTPSEGSQGFACAASSQCRSGICEDEICVFECDPDGDDCAEPFVCGSSDESPGTNVCLGEELDGGGGFCAVGEATTSPRRRAPSWLLVLLAGLGIAGVRRRRGPLPV